MMNGKILHQAVQSLAGPLHKSGHTPSRAAAGSGNLKANTRLTPHMHLPLQKLKKNREQRKKEMLNISTLIIHMLFEEFPSI